MLSFFTIPKTFLGPWARHQRNAIRSWQAALPEAEVLLLGDDPGVAEASAELGVRHLPELARNEAGTPLVSSGFALAEREAVHDRLCYLNTDILLLGAFAEALRRAGEVLPKALMTGRRWDLDVEEELQWDTASRQALLARLLREGTVRTPAAMDYFVFPKGLLGALPPFAVGRPGWDNWLVYHARHRRLAVLDLSEAVLAVHQTHDYSHLRGGEAEYRNGLETRQNQEIAGGHRHFYSLQDATHRLTATGIRSLHPGLHARAVYRILMGLADRWPCLGPAVRRLKNGYKSLVKVPR
jgi:hypothetical protein